MNKNVVTVLVSLVVLNMGIACNAMNLKRIVYKTFFKTQLRKHSIETLSEVFKKNGVPGLRKLFKNKSTYEQQQAFLANIYYLPNYSEKEKTQLYRVCLQWHTDAAKGGFMSNNPSRGNPPY